MKERKAVIVRRAYDAVCKRKGSLPTAAEVAAEAGISLKSARDCMSKERITYQYAIAAHNESVRREICAKREKREKAFRQMYDDLAEDMGRAPTARELIAKTEYRCESTVHSFCRRLGLELTRAQARKQEPKPKREPPAREPYFEQRALPAMTKIIEIRMSGEAAMRPEKIKQAGVGFDITDRVFITCPVCGVRRLIAPRMHPYWLRNQAGDVVFVCKDACTGRVI